MENNSKSFSLDGLLRQNVVLMSGLVTAPIIVACTTMMRALVLVISFFMISYLSILICRIIPRKIAYTFRILFYAVVAAALYIPTILLLQRLFPNETASVMLYIELMVVNLLLLAKTESRFYLISYGKMAAEALVYIVGYALAAFAVGFVREILAYGTLFGFKLFGAILPAAHSPFFGFVLVGLLAAGCRAVVSGSRKES
ncbi:MAG: NADH:ubiquinone oxidoreductase subunit RnfE [Oscillospiraceae bacterium]|nr:NADH:ubiquinone oxidoreductase subunit RnfE [Oscillospiraceae bacterium]